MGNTAVIAVEMGTSKEACCLLIFPGAREHPSKWSHCCFLPLGRKAQHCACLAVDGMHFIGSTQNERIFQAIFPFLIIDSPTLTDLSANYRFLALEDLVAGAGLP